MRRLQYEPRAIVLDRENISAALFAQSNANEHLWTPVKPVLRRIRDQLLGDKHQRHRSFAIKIAHATIANQFDAVVNWHLRRDANGRQKVPAVYPGCSSGFVEKA